LNSQIAIKARKLSAEETNNLIIDSIQDIKGKNIIQLDLRHLGDAPADFFIICEGESTTQVKAISENIHRRTKEEAYFPPVHVEGQRTSKWVCMDYFSTIVHIFHKETRSFYELEDLWSDAKITQYENL